MLEILLMWRLARSIGNLLRAKGRSAGGFQVLAIVLWIGGELLGATVGALCELQAGSYLLALLGAAAGAGLAYHIAASAAPEPGFEAGAAIGEVFE